MIMMEKHWIQIFEHTDRVPMLLCISSLLEALVPVEGAQKCERVVLLRLKELGIAIYPYLRF